MEIKKVLKCICLPVQLNQEEVVPDVRISNFTWNDAPFGQVLFLVRYSQSVF
jgi:hypothetical protein